jgi:hypothetical protein
VNPDAQDLARRLISAVPPWRDDDLARDLCPEMLKRIDHTPARFGCLESALVAGAVVLFAVFPEVVPLLLWRL